MQNSQRRVALVTGGSRGVGRGIVEELSGAGFLVFVTGRSSLESFAGAPDNVVPLRCDHTDDEAVAGVFRHIGNSAGRLDVLVNNIWGGSETSMENGTFAWGQPFWKLRPQRWDAMFAAGVRAHYVASCHAAPMMVEQGSGLIVNLSYWAAQKFMGDVAYGVAKAATDKLSHDMAQQLADHGVCALSLYPGLVRTEAILALSGHVDLGNSESPRFVGRAVLALSGDPDVMARSGSTQTTAGLGQEYGFADVDGKRPVPVTLQDF